jgi:hypothetical protein
MTWRASKVAAFAMLLGLGATRAFASPIILNGDFQTGTLTGWTVFTTPNGTNGSGLPNVVSFDTTGGGASLAAHFNVGEVNFDSTEQGGGLSQTFLAATTGLYTFSAAIASQDDAGGSINADGGTFSILIDGSPIATDPLGGFSSPLQILRGTLNGSSTLTAGPHTFAIEIERPFISSGSATPDQFVDNISAAGPTISAVPEPSSILLLGGGLFALARRRQAARRARSDPPTAVS